jgi:hypothetical protein
MAMTDLDKRLLEDGRAWRAAIGTQSPMPLPPAARAGTAWRRWRLPAAAAAALVVVTAGVLGIARGSRSHHAGPATAGRVEIGCSIPGLAVDAAPSGTTALHTSQQAQAVAGIPATVLAKSGLAMVTDPTASKLGIGSADVARLMWVFTAQTTNADPGLDARLAGHGPYIPYPAGTVFNNIWLVDDATLTAAGSFACPDSGTSSAPTSP